MFLGDFSAGCAYLTRADKKKIRLFTSSKFHWLIGDKVDTTVTDETSCAYDRFVCGSLTKEGKTKIKCSEREQIEWREADNGVDQRESLNVIFQCILFGTLCARIVVHGKSFLKAIIPFSAKVFNVGKEFKITKSKVCASVFFVCLKVVITFMAMRCPYLNWVNQDHAEELTEESRDFTGPEFQGSSSWFTVLSVILYLALLCKWGCIQWWYSIYRWVSWQLAAEMNPVVSMWLGYLCLKVLCHVFLSLFDSAFCWFCQPGARCQRPHADRGDTKEHRPPPSGHAPPNPHQHLCDHLVVPARLLIVIWIIGC